MDASTVPRRAHGAPRSARLLRVASDERLVALVRAEHPAAFEALYDRHHRGILAFCRHMLGQREEAEDAVQHTFLAAYNDLRRSSKAIQLRAWLYAIARNRCLSMLRARREQPAGEMVEPATEGLASEVQRREDLRELLRDVDGLPEDQRAALVLAELGAMSHGEIGEVIGVPRAKVKALVFQARESLIASRRARNADCADIRAELATLRGGALRRTHLRRHLHDCAGCRAFREQVADQRRGLALILPVVPTLGLKQAVLGATGGGAAGGGAGGLLAVAAAKGGLVKLCAVTALLGAGTTGAVVGLSALDSDGANGATTGARRDAGRGGAARAESGDPEHPLPPPGASQTDAGTASPGSRSHSASPSPSAHHRSRPSRRGHARERSARGRAGRRASIARRSQRHAHAPADGTPRRRSRTGSLRPHRPRAPRGPVRHGDRKGARRSPTPVTPPPAPTVAPPPAPTSSPDRTARRRHKHRKRRCPNVKRDHRSNKRKPCPAASLPPPPAPLPPAAAPAPAPRDKHREGGDRGQGRRP